MFQQSHLLKYDFYRENVDINKFDDIKSYNPNKVIVLVLVPVLNNILVQTKRHQIQNFKRIFNCKFDF